MYAPSTGTTSTSFTVDEPGGRLPAPDTELQQAISFFVSQRPRLFRIAYRITGGDASSAEDVVQEAWLRWQRTDRGAIKNPEAFLTTTATRLAINVIQSAHHRHEAPSETVAPDPGDASQDPSGQVDQSAAVAQALAAIMARLTRAELAAYLLRNMFDYSYADVSRLLRTSAVNARQLVSRARWRVERGAERSVVEPRSHRHLVAAFLLASRTGEFESLERFLVHHVRPVMSLASAPSRMPAGARREAAAALAA